MPNFPPPKNWIFLSARKFFSRILNTASVSAWLSDCEEIRPVSYVTTLMSYVATNDLSRHPYELTCHPNELGRYRTYLRRHRCCREKIAYRYLGTYQQVILVGQRRSFLQQWHQYPFFVSFVIILSFVFIPAVPKMDTYWCHCWRKALLWPTKMTCFLITQQAIVVNQIGTGIP